MSVITRVLLCFGNTEVEAPPGAVGDPHRQYYAGRPHQVMVAINSWLIEHGHVPLARIDCNADSDGMFLSMGAFTDLDAEAFIALLRSQPWEARRAVQVLLKKEEHEGSHAIASHPTLSRPTRPDAEARRVGEFPAPAASPPASVFRPPENTP